MISNYWIRKGIERRLFEFATKHFFLPMTDMLKKLEKTFPNRDCYVVSRIGLIELFVDEIRCEIRSALPEGIE